MKTKTQEMTKLQALNDETGGKKDYICQLEWKSARTVLVICFWSEVSEILAEVTHGRL